MNDNPILDMAMTELKRQRPGPGVLKEALEKAGPERVESVLRQHLGLSAEAADWVCKVHGLGHVAISKAFEMPDAPGPATPYTGKVVAFCAAKCGEMLTTLNPGELKELELVIHKVAPALLGFAASARVANVVTALMNLGYICACSASGVWIDPTPDRPENN